MKYNPCKWIIEKKANGTYLPTYIRTVPEKHLNPTPSQMYTGVTVTERQENFKNIIEHILKLRHQNDIYWRICLSIINFLRYLVKVQSGFDIVFIKFSKRGINKVIFFIVY